MFSAPHRAPIRRADALRPAAVLAGAGVALLLVAGAIAPHREEAVAAEQTWRTGSEQSVDVAAALEPKVANRDGYASEISPERMKAVLVADHTNYAWAKLVLYYGGWPITDENVTVIVRWMRQENGVDDWWNRNNPLNNGWGIGTYWNSNVNLDEAAYNVADAVHNLGGYSGILAALSSGTSSADATAGAIWASTWASGHYDYGGHWSTAPVPAVVAPADAWGI